MDSEAARFTSSFRIRRGPRASVDVNAGNQRAADRERKRYRNVQMFGDDVCDDRTFYDDYYHYNDVDEPRGLGCPRDDTHAERSASVHRRFSDEYWTEDRGSGRCDNYDDCDDALGGECYAERSAVAHDDSSDEYWTEDGGSSRCDECDYYDVPDYECGDDTFVFTSMFEASAVLPWEHQY